MEMFMYGLLVGIACGGLFVTLTSPKNESE